MEDLLNEMIGRKIDIVCSGGANIRGEVLKVAGGVLHLKDETQACYVAIDKIAVVWQTTDDSHRAGFVSPGALNVK
jgi:hypothetical protein